MSIQIYILSKLMDENNYPYKLKKELSDSIPFDTMSNLTESKLYYHFESLSKQGLIEPVEVIKEANRPDKQVFAITDKGREQLPAKIYQVFEKAELLSDTLVGLINIRFVVREQVITILEQRLEKAINKQTYMKEIYRQIHVEGTKKEVVDFFDGYYTGRIDHDIYWSKKLIEKLKSHAI